VADGVISSAELEQCVTDARTEGKSVEHMLMANFKVRPAQIGPSLAKFFGVPYEPFNAGRIRSEALHGPLKRDFIEEQGWIPLEESPEGLVIMCVDPEAVRGARVVPQVFPRINKFAYRVTTLTEFQETLGQLYGAGAKAARSTSCWPTWTVARSTTAAMMTRWNPPRPTTNSSSSSTRSSSTPTTRRCPTSTSSRCRASSRPASGSGSMAP
jgi:hypothetical protein